VVLGVVVGRLDPIGQRIQFRQRPDGHNVFGFSSFQILSLPQESATPRLGRALTSAKVQFPKNDNVRLRGNVRFCLSSAGIQPAPQPINAVFQQKKSPPRSSGDSFREP
jgi:hypothetical protein